MNDNDPSISRADIQNILQKLGELQLRIEGVERALEEQHRMHDTDHESLMT